MIDHIYKYPRLYLNAEFEENAKISLSVAHVHYLKNVLRKSIGDVLRVFNGRNGEWLCEIVDLGKKQGQLLLTQKIKDQSKGMPQIALYFSPIKKQRMDFLIEKAVELGVCDLYPVIMNRSENRKFNAERTNAQIIEAAEQCERLDLPVLQDVQHFSEVFVRKDEAPSPLYVCLERVAEAKPLSFYNYEGGGAFLIGPEGGFDDREIELISSSENVHIVALGDTILRAETAALACLAYARLSQ